MAKAPPATFVYRADMSADEIPVEQVSLGAIGAVHALRPAEYAKVPSALYPLFQPADRLLLCFIFARDVFGEDAPGGWTKLGSGLTERFGLTDRYIRRRAIKTVERDGRVEVRRRVGACTLLRLAVDLK
jgi:hypothetical protein